ncbi:hypothetical protein C8F04DRAFT_1398713 [Mycena alexandri]|uniref:Uncharacterized protein n=1 Tax=Mycena alexandri TaxID=1745969 RepID=A0AAD6SJU0_9AGAR|nr:hypothetical protein C8F04DRAFT_1398713 [Mycena alexandri]
MNSDSSPVLPLELEREIFEGAAICCPQTIPSLLLVSHRVYEWIEKIKYRTVTPTGDHSTCSYDTLMRAIQSDSKSPSFFRAHVHHLYIRPYDETDEVQEILHVCTGIQSLALIRSNIPSFLLPTLATLRPQRLWGYFSFLLDKKDFGQSMFIFVTHLTLWEISRQPDRDIPVWLSFLAMFPSLTHLKVPSLFKTTLVPHILASSKMLEVLVKDSSLSGEELYNVDDRYVTLELRGVIGQWVMGARGGNDFWARAEAFIAKKRRREIQPDWRYWIEDADGI